MTTSQLHARNVRWQTVALPTEHGGWGFVSEPLLLGLLLAPGLGSVALSIAAFAAFLLRQPLKITLKDHRAGRIVPRTLAARRFVMIYGGVMVLASVVMLLALPSWMPLVPLALAVPLIAFQLWHDVQNRGRSLNAELAGALATGAFAAAIVLMAGWTLVGALALWLALGIKGITAVLYVRSRLRLERDKPAMRAGVMVAHIGGLVALLVIVLNAALPLTALAAMAILTVRAGVGLSPLRKSRPPKIIGMQEMAYGLGFVLLVALGYFAGL